MLGGWVNPHREQQTIPQGQTSKPAQIFPHANGTFYTHTAASMKRATEKFVVMIIILPQRNT